MSNESTVRRALRRGFTLVELLVVIGIIALLISILLPTLNRARQSAKSVACLSNERQIGLGFTGYSLDAGGRLPFGEVNRNYKGRQYNSDNQGTDWPILISAYLGLTTEADWSADKDVTAAFLCPAGSAGKNTSRTQYSSHPALVPSLNSTYDPMSDPTNVYPEPYKMSSVRNNSEIAVAWDGVIKIDPNYSRSGGSAFVSRGLRWLDASGTERGYITAGKSCLLPYWEENEPTVLANPVIGSVGEDGTNSFSYLAPSIWGIPSLRHGGKTNYVYLDGHAASVDEKATMVRQFLVLAQ